MTKLRRARALSLLTVPVAAFALSACSVNSENFGEAIGYEGSSVVGEPDFAPEMAVESADASFEDAFGEPGDYVSVSGEARVITSDPSAAAAEFKDEVLSVEGEVESIWENDQDEYRSSTLVVRVPAEEYESVVELLDNWGKVEFSSTNQVDLHGDFIDTKAHQQALEESLQRVEKLAESATSTSELLQAEELLSQQKAELDSWNEQMKWLEEQVDMSLLSVTFDTHREGAGPSISFGWVGDVLAQSFNTLVWTVIFVIPWMLTAGLVLAIWRTVKVLRKKRDR